MNPRNQVMLIGNLGADPESRGKTKSDRTIANFAIAQTILGRDAGNQKLVNKGTQWFQVSCFSGLADRVCASLKKGDLVLVSGELKARSYTHSSGEKRVAVEVVGSDVFRIERLKSFASPAEEQAPQERADEEASFDEWEGEAP